MIWIDWIVIIAAILLIVAVSFMSSEDDIKDAFSGEKSELFKNRKARGFELFLMRFAAVVGLILVVGVILSNNLH